MLNLNKTWVQKARATSWWSRLSFCLPVIIWYLKDILRTGSFCTFPHAIEFLNRRYAQICPDTDLLSGAGELPSPFMDAWLGGATEQLVR